MDFGIPHRILCEDDTAPNHVYPGNCRLIGIFCASVGLTGLPSDGTDPLPPATSFITGVNPPSIGDGALVTISGTNLRPGGNIGKIFLGGVEQVRWSIWIASTISFYSEQQTLETGVPHELLVEFGDGTTATPPAGMTVTFTPLGAVVINSMSPATGTTGTRVTVGGQNFGGNSPAVRVMIGMEDQEIQNWAAGQVTFNAVQGVNVQDTPIMAAGLRNDGTEFEMGPFTFNAVGMTLSRAQKAAAAKKGRSRKSITTTAVDEHGTDVTMPEFASGAGIMIRNGAGDQILVGPFELLAKTVYNLPMNCPNGIEIVPSGKFDITLLLAPPL